MKILITGGAGYIGSHTILEVIENNNWNVISADNFIHSSTKTFNRISNIAGKKIINYNIDLADTNSLKKIFTENPDINGVIHFAALKSVPESIANPELYFHNNIKSLTNILECIREQNIKYFIFSSSCTVYGNIESSPVNEETPLLKPASPYGETKQKGEEIIAEFSKKNHDINSISLRYFNPAGAHMSGLIGEEKIGEHANIFPAITNAAINNTSLHVFGDDYNTRDGSCIRDYVHVSDIATAHVLALQYLINKKNKSNYEVFNLGTGTGISVLEAIHAFEKVSGKKLNVVIDQRRPGDISSIYSDSSKAKNKLGWNPKYDIDDMMESAWKWQVYAAKENQ